MENLELYEKVRAVPETAQREILGGKLKGKTDINPMWRIKTLTEQFGICGVGWKAPITQTWIDEGAKGERIANVRINLYIKVDGQWSDPIEGIGGSTLVATERGGLASNDEAYKMAYTDAISVACKMLGMGADIYWRQDSTKYSKETENTQSNQQEYKCSVCGKPISKTWYDQGITKYGNAFCSEECKNLASDLKKETE